MIILITTIIMLIMMIITIIQKQKQGDVTRKRFIRHTVQNSDPAIYVSV